MLRDLRFALQALRRRQGFTLVAVLTIAVGIGASTAILSIVHGVLLRPLPYAHAERIGILWHEFGNGAQNLPVVNPLDAHDYRDRSQVFETFTIARGYEWILGDPDNPESVDVGLVEAGFFELFGAAPLHGRTFTVEEDHPGAAPVAMLSHRLWARRFGADPDVVGTMIDLNGERMEVVGVLPPSFRLHLPAEAFLLRDAELWVSMRLDRAAVRPRNVTLYTAFGRLRPGATFAQGQAEIDAMAEQLKREHPVHDAANLRARIAPLLDDVVKHAETPLVFLLAAVGLVLLIACANVAILLIVRGHSRAHEYSLRAALGAGRRGLVRLAFVESTVLSAAGAATGIALAAGVVAALEALEPGGVPRLDEVVIDATVLFWAVLLTAATSLLFGLLPALQSASSEPVEALASGVRSPGSPRQRRSREMLVVCEIAASLVLLIGTGLMVRSFAALARVEPGYHTSGALTFRVSLPPGSIPDLDAQVALMDELFETLSGLPDVEAVTAIRQLPLTGSGSMQPIAYDEETATNWESASADLRLVWPGFFEVAGARLLAGRPFSRDDLVRDNVVVIDEGLARRAFPNGDPVGQRLQVRPNGTPEAQRYAEVIGVVESLRLRDLNPPTMPQLYWPMTETSRFSVWVQSSGDPALLAPAIRSELARLAPGAPVEDIRPIAEIVSRALAPARLTVGLMSAFGCVALFLAAVGIYGLLSHTLAQRTREIGIRMALGEAPASVRRSVLAGGMRLVVAAVALGLPAAAALSTLAAGLWYGVGPLDPPTYLVTTIVLVAAAIAASWVPARRATRVDPLAALNSTWT